MAHPGQITWKQIPVMTKMACGARQPVTYNGNGLRFKVAGRMRWIEVELDATDTYTVRLVRITRNHDRKVEDEVEGIYCDMLGEAVYYRVNK